MDPICLKSAMKVQNRLSGMPFANEISAMNKKRAFSLVEILVVVAIIGIIALVGIPAFSKFYQMYKMRTMMNQLVNDIRAARQTAITEGIPVKITFLDLTLYPQMQGVTGGYAIYKLNSTNLGGSGATLANWKEISPRHGACGTRAERPRFFPVPVSVESGTDLKDVDKDTVADLVFKSDGSVYRGPYPADKTSPDPVADFLTFVENTASPPTAPNATPRIILQTPARITFDRYCISFSLFGKISVQPFHS